MTKVLFDDQIFTGQKIGGISRYFSQLFKEFEKGDVIDYKLPLMYSENIYLKDLKKNRSYAFLEGKKFKGRDRLLNFFRKINRQSSKICLSAGRFDVFHPTDYDPYFLDYLNNKPFVITIYDMIHEIYAGEFFDANDSSLLRKRLLAEKAAKIIAISQNTKNDIIKFCGINESKVSVIYLANSLDVNLSIPIAVPEKFLLFVGSRGRYKNFNFFIESISPILQKDRRLNVICVGGSDFTSEEELLFVRTGVRDQVLRYIVSDSQLVYLYKKALAFVFPTLYEGFGLPMVEAAACGCPVIASNCEVLKEVGQDAALYFDGRDCDSILQVVSQVIENENLRSDLISKGIVHVKNFSWAESARETANVYRGV
ncbi:MAG: glycosyltransferase family 1 protein [Candidatus Babeliales bacterium]|jgi:glycosyltransferase involved in cell wall biosynthesis